ncbi:hypothetical protein KY289_009071 [Solanum tuberosum]|nr:hypothetical protein KY289_009071 [Solanum tuberosum]
MENNSICSILIHHGGRWDATGRYVEYHLEGVIYNSDTKYIGLVAAIADQLGMDTPVDELNIMYVLGKRQKSTYVNTQ